MSRMYTRILLFTVWFGIGVPSFRGACCLHRCVSTMMTEPARTYHTLLVATPKTKIRLCISVPHSVFRSTFLGFMFSRTPSWERPVSHIVHKNFQNHCLLQVIGWYKPAMRRFPEDIYEIVKTDMTALHIQVSGSLTIGPTRQAMWVST
jgi:hypothetical protein